MSKFRAAIKIIFKSRLIMSFPNRSEILIFDDPGNFLKDYLNRYKTTTINIRGESLYIPVLLLSIFTYDFVKGKFLSAYLKSFIKFVKPKILVTHIHNNANFYYIKNYFPTVTTIFIENGVTGEIPDKVKRDAKYEFLHVDYMFVLTESRARYYSKYIKGNAIVLGSIKSNQLSIKKLKINSGVIFISQVTSNPQSNKPFIFNDLNRPIYWDEFYLSEKKVLQSLDNWCAENNLSLQICGRNKLDNHFEYKFYSEILQKSNWNFLERGDKLKSYEYVDEAEMVVFVDSALGYESIGRGKKSVALSCRSKLIGIESFRFSWPEIVTESGPFWTNSTNETDHKRLLSRVWNLETQAWINLRKTHTRYGIEYKAGNHELFNTFDSILNAKP
jgi:surface carbohydrate biosynthesis protein